MKVGAVLVAGGGIGGVQASLDLAESGYFVYLLEESPAIGGVMAQLDKTFPTNDCAMCILSPKLVECGRHPNIQILTHSQIEKISGREGEFRVSIVKRPRFVDETRCVGCGICAEKCPVKVEDGYNEGLGLRKAIYIPYPQAVPRTYIIDKDRCLYFTKGRCRLCEKFCQSKAVNFEEKEERRTLEVGSVILVPGFDKFPPQRKHLYGYGKFKNVITSLQFERMLSASGPYQGQLQRPSDGRHPKRIAFIQCVGSRDLRSQRGYCSAVCCMYAVKEAIIAKEHDPNLEITIFYIDLRAYGKGFEEYFEKSKTLYRIRFERSMVADIEEVSENGNLLLRYIGEEGGVKKEEFDMVVLSIGIEPPKSSIALAEMLNLELNDHGFCKTSEFSPLETNRPGILVAGAFQGPKDIPETVMQASGAAGIASALLSSARRSLVAEREVPPEMDVTSEPPRIGVFVCHCGVNIGAVVDVPKVREYASTLPHVVLAEENLYTCSQDTQDLIKEKIKEHGLNRVVVAACTPRTHEPLFRETLREAGLNPYLFEMANIRDQCSWVHTQRPEEATEKAKELVKMAVVKASLIEPLPQRSLEVNHAALVVGGGVSGMVAALNLAEQGFEVHLLERSMNLGGIARRIHFTLEGEDVQRYLKELVSRLSEHPLIHVYTRANIVGVSGYVGNFTTTFTFGPKREKKDITHGVTIIATGASELKTTEYLYKKDQRVLTLLELEGEIAKKSRRVTLARNLVMIQCVGSREKEHPYCSRVCCTHSLKLALKVKEVNPEANVYILYRDMRSYGFKEDYYQRAREKGVVFIRYEPENKPQVETAMVSGRSVLRVKVKDPLLKEVMIIDSDLLALAVGVVAPPENKEISQLFKVPLTSDGFFLEAHMKLRPVDFATDGIFLTGLAHAPKLMTEAIFQAQAAAARATTLLAKDVVLSEGMIASIEKALCSGCKLCVEICPYGAISFREDSKTAEVNEMLCKGCGSCAAACPSGACQAKNFKDEQILKQIEALI